MQKLFHRNQISVLEFCGNASTKLREDPPVSEEIMSNIRPPIVESLFVMIIDAVKQIRKKLIFHEIK